MGYRLALWCQDLAFRARHLELKGIFSRQKILLFHTAYGAPQLPHPHGMTEVIVNGPLKLDYKITSRLN